jgi:hypothetical protein
MDNQKQVKLDMQYAVKSDISNHKEVDLSKRTVDLIANTFYYCDAVADVLVPGCCVKSIQERGPKSTNPGKIKHLMFHNWEKVIGRCDTLEETKMNNRHVLRANSYFPETVDAEQELIKYQEELYDQHSIGYRYLNVELVEPESKPWDSYLKLLINPDDAINMGVMYIVKEIALFEYSTVFRGCNVLTEYLGVKSDNKNIQYNNLITKLDALTNAYRQGVSDKYMVEMQERQIKQMIYELIHNEPVDKSTLDLEKRSKPGNANTQKIDYNFLINKI